jgi:hypothetical protein
MKIIVARWPKDLFIILLLLCLLVLLSRIMNRFMDFSQKMKIFVHLFPYFLISLFSFPFLSPNILLFCHIL